MRIRLSSAGVAVLAALVFGSCSETANDSRQDHTAASQSGKISSSDQPDQTELLAAAERARASFASGAPSMDALVDQFIQALSNQDKEALNQLRVSKTEYLDLIVPGTVPVGQRPRQVSEQPKEYFWSMLDTKSHYYAERLLGQFGGRTYHAHELTLTRPSKEYAWYKAYGQVKMELHGDDDATYHLISGWVAEVDGRYKFIGFNYES